jgi:hypothetical protein
MVNKINSYLHTLYVLREGFSNFVIMRPKIMDTFMYLPMVKADVINNGRNLAYILPLVVSEWVSSLKLGDPPWRILIPQLEKPCHKEMVIRY